MSAVSRSSTSSAPSNDFIEDEHRRRNDSNASQMSRYRAPKYPYQQQQNRDHGDAGAHAVGQLDQGRQARMGLHHDPIAQRPMVAAAGAGAGSTDHRAPQNRSDVVDQNCPGKARQRLEVREVLQV